MTAPHTKPESGAPKGCICILTGPKGLSFVGTAFNLDRPGGMRLKEAQQHYAKQSMLFTFWRESTSFWMTENGGVRIGEYDIERMVSQLIDKRENGWRVSYHYVGHGDEE